MINAEYEFSVRMSRDEFNQYVVTMVEISQDSGMPPTPIHFVFDTGATYTMLNKSFAEAQGWRIFKKGLLLGSYVKGGVPTVCDLRKIPKLAFGMKQINDLVVATPADEMIKVSNLLGRSFIDNFHHGINQDAGRIYFKERTTDVDPDFSFSQIAHNSPVNL